MVVSASVDARERVREHSARERVAGRYELIARIGSGGMGEVFAARELSTGRALALKRLLSATRRRQTAFRAEYHALARLKHPYIIDVYEFGVDAGQPYYTMELLDGHDLHVCPTLNVREVCRIVRDVACSLALLHSQKLLHRDVSPGNVQRTASGVCKLIDFGAMMPFGVAPNLAGTAPFVSPEAWEGALLDQRADLYALGALAYWLLSRQLPGDPRELTRGGPPRTRPVRLGSVAPEIPRELERLVMSLLELDPNRRPASAVEVIARLSGFADPGQLDLPLLARSHLGSAPLVGRAAELSALDDALTRALQRNGGALLVSGAEGSGKTRFLQEVSLGAQTKGFSVVRAFAAHAGGGAHVARALYRSLRCAAPELFERLPAAERGVLATFDWRETQRSQAPPAETRARLQWALGAYFRAVSTHGPWLLLIDDLDLADEFSIAFLTALTAMAETLPLLIVATRCTHRSRPDAGALEALCQRAQSVALADLQQDDAALLVTSLFGHAANAERLASQLFREARGNPGLTLELCSWLLERGRVRFTDGSFVLPEGELHEELAAADVRSLSARLQGLSPAAHELVELIASCRGGVSLDLCLAARRAPSEETLSGVQELVRRGILMSSGRDYVFTQDALRCGVRRSLDARRARTLHRLLARAYLKLQARGPLTRLEAAWHLVHTERELAGAELLLRVTPGLIDSGVASADAIRGLEKALEVFERRSASLEKVLAIRAQLARASYLYDYRLARYADATIAQLWDWSGLALVSRWERFLPRSAALLACVAIIGVRRLLRRPAARGPGPRETFKYLLGAVIATIGVRLTALDARGALALLARIRVFRGPRSASSAAAVYSVAEAVCVQACGREAEVGGLLRHAERAIDNVRDGRLSDEERRNVRVGLRFSAAILECYRLGSRALERADALEAEGTRLARAAAHRIRFTYYVVRGMREKADAFRRELELHGIQGGTTWQVDWYAVPTEGMASALLGDPVGTSRALARLEDLSASIASMAPMRDMVRIGHHLCRGEHALAIEQGERFVAAHPPGSIIGWGTAYAAYAAALNHSGRHQEAATLCADALATLAPEEAHEYIVLYGPLARELGYARAGLGQVKLALAMSNTYLARLEAAGEHALLAQAYASRAVVARVLQDRGLLAEALSALRRAAAASGSAAVMQQAARVTQTGSYHALSAEALRAGLGGTP
jgi:hypothetical protein